MPVVTLSLTNASTTGGWANTGGALALGGGYASLLGNAANGWLVLTTLAAFAANVPANARIDSLLARVILDAPVAAPAGGETQALDVALTFDGAAPTGVQNVAYYETDRLTAAIAAPTRAQLAAGAFGIMVRRGTGAGEVANVERRIDRIELDVAFTVIVPGLAMADPRIDGLQRRVVAFQTGPDDTTTNPSLALRCSYYDIKPQIKYEEIGFAGQLVPGDRVKTYEDASGDIAGPGGKSRLDYNEMLVHLSSMYGKPVTETIVPPTASQQGAYRHEWNIDPRQYVKPGLIVQHTGDIGVGEEHRHIVVNSLTMGGTKETTTVSGNVMARAQKDQGKPAGARSCVQTLTIAGTPTSGGYQLAYEGASTGTISFNANAGAIQTALAALSTIGAGNVSVTGTGPFTITFAGAMAGIEQALIDIRASGLVGGTVAVAISTQGGWKEMEIAPFTGLQATLYLSADVATLGTDPTKIGELYSYSLAASDRYATKDVVGRTDETFKGVLPQPWKWTTSLGLQADVNGQALAALARQNGDAAGRYLRHEWISPQEVRTGTPYSLVIDLYGKLSDAGDVTTFGVVRGRSLMFETNYDAARWGRSGRIVLVCAAPNPIV